MTYYKDQPVVIMPRAKLVAFNAYIQRHGYGANFARRGAINKGASSTAPATHYVVECPCDNGMAYAIQGAADAIPGVKITKGRRGPKRMAEVLDKEGLKPKPRKKQR